MRKKKWTRIAIRLALIAVVIFGGYRWAYGGQPITYASTLTAADMLAYDAKADTLPYVKLMADHPATDEGSNAQPITLNAVDYAGSDPAAKLAKADGAL